MKKFRVLIVEQDKNTRTIFLEYFKNKFPKVEVVCLSNAIEALKLLDGRSDFKFVIYDFQMPLISGAQFLDFKTSCPYLLNVPVIISSTDLRDRRKAILKGASEIILKPISLNNFNIVINKILNLFLE